MAVVGIDLGTTNTVVACVRDGQVHVLPDEDGRTLLPSVVSFHPNGEILVGHMAKDRRVVDAKNTIASVKRVIGRAWSSDEIRRARQRFAFELKEGPDAGPVVVARGQNYTLPEISAFVLKRARVIAEKALGEKVDRAVITVPANFNELQRAATQVAAKIAGLDVIRVINEPTAAALAYGVGQGAHERIAVYDFGGGTFDCTLLELSGNVFEVLATAGDSFLGGDDLDVAIADCMAEAFLRSHRYDPKANPQSFERLRVAAESLKIGLSSEERRQVRLADIAFGLGGASLHLDFAMTRDELEALANPFIERTLAVCQDAMAEARLPVSAIDRVILVGGSTRIPLVRSRVEQFFGIAPLDQVNPEEVVAVGAAIQAAALTGAAPWRGIPSPPVPTYGAPTQPSLPDFEDDDLGDDEMTIATPTEALLVADERGAPDSVHRAPAEDRARPIFSQGIVPVLVDVTPRALVVETAGGWCDVLVKRNAKIPCERTRAFATSSDMQTVVKVRVAQGEEPLFAQNTYLGEVELSDLRAAPRGQVTIQVRFEVDESGTLEVAATEGSTGRKAQARLKLVGISAHQTIEQMKERHDAAAMR
jgi:molecular chaperone DnaK